MIARLGSQTVIGCGAPLDSRRHGGPVRHFGTPTAGMPAIACIDKAPLGTWDA
jgi:hypothetical protein